MVEPVAAFTLFDKVLAGLGLLREEKRRRNRKIDQALLALYAAIAETRTYLLERREGASRSRDKEYAIARLWHKASVPLREIDTEFADRCFIKGGYWMEPEAWDEAQINQKRIAIDAVFEETRSLLSK